MASRWFTCSLGKCIRLKPWSRVVEVFVTAHFLHIFPIFSSDGMVFSLECTGRTHGQPMFMSWLIENILAYSSKYWGWEKNTAPMPSLLYRGDRIVLPLSWEHLLLRLLDMQKCSLVLHCMPSPSPLNEICGRSLEIPLGVYSLRVVIVPWGFFS